MRVVLYARCSSDNQRKASIKDRFGNCPQFAAGSGPRTIRRMLNEENVRGPSHNPGARQTRNRRRTIKDPATGKWVWRLNPENKWLEGRA